MDYAVAEDVQDAYEGTADLTGTRLTYLLSTTNARLTAMIPALPAWITSGLVDPDLARDTVVRAVLRQIRNPTETSQTQTDSQTAGPFSRTISFRQGGNRTVFEDEDLALLRPPSAQWGPIRMRPWPHMYHRRHW